MTFSQRNGFSNIRTQLQLNQIDGPLRNSIWNVLVSCFWPRILPQAYEYNNQTLDLFIRSLWRDFYKIPVDSIPRDLYQAVQIVRNAYFDEKLTEWFVIYDLLEFCAAHLSKPSYHTFTVTQEAFISICNDVFIREKSGYRFVGDLITPLTSSHEIEEIERSIEGPFAGTSSHIKQALNLLSNRINPDFRNSIKESISAVESTCKVITNNPSATLGEGLKKLEENDVKLHPALKDSFNKLYGYTSDEKGIRHGLVDDDNQLNFDDAKFMLVSCSAFCNYLISKVSKKTNH
ncbi:hypothetical protein LJR153_005066 [Paenibacillus sp. LjRoot153]|uniref:AbiJ-NTD4 domain-containing protein n=1 Tax=Paenibacillus sp. LjRoot153 TaxID=3342270 RepID=UPI003ECD290E